MDTEAKASGFVELDRVEFCPATAAEIRLVTSKVRVEVPSPAVDLGRNHTLHDTRMGAFLNVRCETCGLYQRECAGHFGHIDLAVPVLNPGFRKTILARLLRTFCAGCARAVGKGCECPAERAGRYALQQIPIRDPGIASDGDDDGDDDGDAGADDSSTKGDPSEGGAKANTRRKPKRGKTPGRIDRRDQNAKKRRRLDTRDDGGTNVDTEEEENEGEEKQKTQDQDPTSSLPEAAMHDSASRRSGLRFVVRDMRNGRAVTLRALYRFVASVARTEYLQALGAEFERYRDLADAVFVHALPVLPVGARLPTRSGGAWRPHALTLLYAAVLRKNEQLRDALTQRLRGSLVDDYVRELQDAVNVLFDVRNTGRSLRPRVAEAGGLRQLVDGKQGRIRANLMGKRVEYCARSVLSGDPALGIDEVGLPRSVCANLTVPERVTCANFGALRRWRIRYVRKPPRHPGDMEQRFDADAMPGGAALAMVEIGDTVERALQNGDLVVVNRQPSLHRASMCAMRARIFDCDTIRLNYSCMPGLAGDCDGDELNVHVPQDLASRAELETLMLMSTNIVCSQSSRPLLGLTQDSLLGAHLLSRDMLDERDFWDIAYKAGFACGPASERACHPAVLKPRRLFCGAQLVDLALVELEIDLGPRYAHAGVLALRGRLVSALFAKGTLGIAEGSLVHAIFLRHGSDRAARFMHLVQRAADHYLNLRGFSVGPGDCVVKHDALDVAGVDARIRGDLETRGRGPDEAKLCAALGSVTQLPADPDDRDADNRLLDMIRAGSKGSIVNFNQITRMLGQQFCARGRLEPELARQTRALPHHTRFDQGLDARGFVASSFAAGLSPVEFWNHAKPSRVTMIDTACKTSVTGAQQRRLVKSLEKAVVSDAGDGRRMVRNMVNGKVVQFDYGEDGLDGVAMLELEPAPPAPGAGAAAAADLDRLLGLELL